MGDERKAKAQADFKKAFQQIREGCGRSVCFNPSCHNYPYTARLDQAESIKYALKGLTEGSFQWCAPLADISLEGAAIMYTFGNFDVVGAGFVETTEADGRASVTRQSPSLQFDEIRVLYQKAASLVESGQLSPMWLRLALSSAKLTDYSSLFLPRALLVVLESQDLMLPEHSETLELIVKLMLEMDKKQVEEFTQWAGSYTGEHLVQLVYVFQQFITVHILERPRKEFSPAVVSAIGALELLHSANQLHHRVPYYEFYNDAVNKETDMKIHFIAWKSTVDPSYPSPGRHFSVLFHPWILDSATKSRLFEAETSIEQRHYLHQTFFQMFAMGQPPSPYLVLDIRRESLILDTIRNLQRSEEELKKPLKVHFVGEEGVDGGGLQKEFFQLVLREIFDPQFSMFSYHDDTRLYWFNPDTVAGVDEFELIGKVLGLALYNSVILDVHLPLAIYKKLMGVNTSLEDLESFNPQLAKGLKEVRKMQGDVEMILCRNFVVETAAYGAVIQHELKPGGAQIPVTGENKGEYVQLYVDWVLNKSCEHGFRAFRNGFRKVCDGAILNMFRPEELELLICGNPVLDFYELEKACVYEDGYTRESRTCQMLWKVLHSLSEDHKKKFLFFVTGSDRAPIDGLGSMRFIISRNGPDSDRLMTAHTCFNHLLLPEYTSEQKIRDMVLLAIYNSEGFGLR